MIKNSGRANKEEEQEEGEDEEEEEEEEKEEENLRKRLGSLQAPAPHTSKPQSEHPMPWCFSDKNSRTDLKNARAE